MTLNLTIKRDSLPERGWWLKDPSSDRKAFGMVLHQSGDKWMVARTLIGSPAEKAGVTKGEHLISVDEYEVGLGKGEMSELHVLLALDDSIAHRLTFQAVSGAITRDVEKEDLRGLLEYDHDHGGLTLGVCVGCRTCRPNTIGATDCSSGCPGNYCTVG